MELVSLYEGNFSLLVNDIDLIQLLPDDSDLRQHVFGDSSVKNNFKLAEYIANNNYEAALEIVDSMERNDRNSITLLIWMLTRDCNALNALKMGRKNLKEFGIWDNQINLYQKMENRLTKNQITEVTSILDDADKKVTNDKPLDLSITKSVVTMLFTAALMFFLFRSLAKSYKTNGSIAAGVGRFFEPIVIYIRDDIAIPNIGKRHYRRYMSYLLTIFFFVWFLNILGLSPLGINVTGNIAVTFGLALLTFLITNLTANKNYWAHIFWMPGVPILMKIVLAPIELLGVVIKPFSLLIRLYANIQAGHIVLMSLIGLMFIFNNWLGSSLSFVLAFAISIIEVLVALLQAYIFTMLSALYFGFAVEEHEEAH